jgi:acetoin utilization protein AcuB
MNTEPVRNWMTGRLMTITPQTTLPEAQRIMLECNIRRLLVLEDDKLVGIVTLGDIREAKPSTTKTLSIYELNSLLDQLTVKDFMTSNPITIAPDATVGGLPVVENGRLVGIITETDFCRLLMMQPEQGA